MRATDIVRKVDQLGRVVPPKELRDTMDIDEKEPLKIYVEGDKVIFNKVSTKAIFCGDVEAD